MPPIVAGESARVAHEMRQVRDGTVTKGASPRCRARTRPCAAAPRRRPARGRPEPRSRPPGRGCRRRSSPRPGPGGRRPDRRSPPAAPARAAARRRAGAYAGRRHPARARCARRRRSPPSRSAARSADSRAERPAASGLRACSWPAESRRAREPAGARCRSSHRRRPAAPAAAGRSGRGRGSRRAPAMTWAFVATRPVSTTQPEPCVPTPQAVPWSFTTDCDAARAPGLWSTLGSGGGRVSCQPRQERERVEAVQRLEHPVGRHCAEQARQDRGGTDLGPKPQRRLVEREDGQEPADRQRDQPAEGDPSDPVDRARAEDAPRGTSRTGRPSAPASSRGGRRRRERPCSPATGSQAEFSEKRCGATSDPSTAPSASPPSESAWAASPRCAPRMEKAATPSSRRTSTTFTPTGYGASRLDDEVDELARARRSSLRISLPSTCAATRGSVLRARDELVLGQADRHLDPVAHLAVHLDDELERVPLEQAGIGLRPRAPPTAARGRAAPRAPRRRAARTAGSG